MLIKNKNSFVIRSDFDSDFDSDSVSETDIEFDYEEGDCFDLDDEWKPIPRVLKKELCDKIRIKNYILFSTIMTLFGYLLYKTISEVYK